MDENWYGDRFKGTFLTDTLLPNMFACIAELMLACAIIVWLKGR
jgi:hypothetical protein